MCHVDEIDIDVSEANVNHNALLNFVANEHIDHSGVSVTGGVGLSGGGAITSSSAIDLDINSLAADATPDSAADYVVTYDASAAGHKKVLLDDLPAPIPTISNTIVIDGYVTVNGDLASKHHMNDMFKNVLGAYIKIQNKINKKK